MRHRSAGRTVVADVLLGAVPFDFLGAGVLEGGCLSALGSGIIRRRAPVVHLRRQMNITSLANARTSPVAIPGSGVGVIRT